MKKELNNGSKNQLNWNEQNLELFVSSIKSEAGKKIPSEIFMFWKHALSIYKNPSFSLLSGHDLIPG